MLPKLSLTKSWPFLKVERSVTQKTPSLDVGEVLVYPAVLIGALTEANYAVTAKHLTQYLPRLFTHPLIREQFPDTFHIVSYFYGRKDQFTQYTFMGRIPGEPLSSNLLFYTQFLENQITPVEKIGLIIDARFVGEVFSPLTGVATAKTLHFLNAFSITLGVKCEAVHYLSANEGLAIFRPNHPNFKLTDHVTANQLFYKELVDTLEK